MGSPCSFLLHEQKCLLPPLTQLPNAPNKAITNSPVQYKTVASNGFAMARSVEPWTLDPPDWASQQIGATGWVFFGTGIAEVPPFDEATATAEADWTFSNGFGLCTRTSSTMLWKLKKKKHDVCNAAF